MADKADKKRQFSCRPDDETLELIEALKVDVAKALGVVRLSDPSLLKLAMLRLRKDYPPAEVSPARARKEK